jgi:hypothetical protein
MENVLVKDVVKMRCPVCGRVHNVEIRSQMISATHNHRHIFYVEEYSCCTEKNEEFWTKEQTEKNLKSAKKALETAREEEKNHGKRI